MNMSKRLFMGKTKLKKTKTTTKKLTKKINKYFSGEIKGKLNQRIF